MTIDKLLDRLAQARMPCLLCEGKGDVNISSPGISERDDCPDCDGTGTVLVFRKALWKSCYTCYGSGRESVRGTADYYSRPCFSCSATGIVRRTFTEPLEAVGPILAELYEAIKHSPIQSLDYPDPLVAVRELWVSDPWPTINHVVRACERLGWLERVKDGE